MLQLDPLSEAAYRALMIAHYYNGQRTEALATYQNCWQKLCDELDVGPAAETNAIYQAILNSEFPRQVPNARLREPVRLPSNNVPSETIPILGRQAELDRLGKMLQDARVRLLTITGVGGR